MKNRIFLAIIVSICIYSCQENEKPNPFEISNNHIGLLTNETKVSQLDSIFSNDSIVKGTTGNQFLSNANEIEIFEKGGVKLLVLEPQKESDPNATIQSIQIIDPRYRTSSGLSAGSTFKDIKDQYEISKINNTLSTAVIFVDSIQAYFTIDKKQLPQEFQFTTDKEIKASDIPDESKIKHFWISWDKN